MQFCDFSILQEQKIKNGNYEKQLNYWKNKLAFTLPINLPYDFKRPDISKNMGDSYTLQISPQVTRSIKKLCYTREVSLYITLLSAFGIFLQRLSGNKVINIGLPTANRYDADYENVIGFFAGLILARFDFEDELTFNECLNHVKKDMYKAYDNQDIPFDKIYAAINPPKNDNENILYQILFDMLTIDDNAFEIINTEIQEIKFEIENKTNTDLVIYITDKVETLELTAKFRVDLFKKSTIEKILKRYCYFLSQITDDPDKIISEYSLKLPDIKLEDSTKPILC
jgi:non-ribosomal peptide synthetase component F